MRGTEYGVQHLTIETPTILIEIISGLVSTERARELLALGSIYVNNTRITEPALDLKTGDLVRAHLEPRRFSFPSDLADRIVEENDDYLVVDKPAGLPVHALVDNEKENLLSFLEEIKSQKLLVTHRLDIDTTGLVVVAKNLVSQVKINEAFKSQKMKRQYLAVIEKPIEPGTYVHFMEQSPKAPKQVFDTMEDGRLRCELVVESCTPLSLGGPLLHTSKGRNWIISSGKPKSAFEVEIRLVTGRTQQIRAQFAHLGAPLIGDTIYGSSIPLKDASTFAAAIALWAFRIQTTGDEEIFRPGKGLLT